MSVRADLLALTPAALASLTNMGLVKRAQRELDAGRIPVIAIAEGSDGDVVSATFDDGATATLVPGKGLRDVPCTCGATTGCRHRLGAVLAYQLQQMSGSTTTTTTTTTATATTTTAPWSPADVDDAAIVKLLGDGTVERARKLMKAGYIAEVKRGGVAGGSGDDVPTVHLQTSSVRFLVSGDASYARCDCTQKTACLHVALAVWAFREKDRRDKDAPVLVVEVGTAGGAQQTPLAVAAAVDVVRLIVDEGLARLPPAAAGRIALAKDALTRANFAWPLLAVEELEALIEQHRRRSALFHPQRLRHVLVEVAARAAAARGSGALPARAVLGADEALSTKLDQARFVGLGATVEADGDDRRVRVLLADPGGSGVYVLERVFRRAVDQYGDKGDIDDGPALGLRGTVGGASVAVLASGQMVSNAVSRQANRTITVSTGGLQKTSVTRGGFSLERLPKDRVVDGVDACIAARRARAPSFLRPRLVADDIDVVVIDSVDDVVWDPGAQAVIAVCRDKQGAVIVVERSFNAVTPTATQALALAMSSSVRRDPEAPKPVDAVSAVVGRVKVKGELLVVEPIAVFADRLVVLDLEPKSAAAEAAQAALTTGQKPLVDDVIAGVLAGLSTYLDEVIQQGVRTMSAAQRTRGTKLVEVANHHGLLRIGAGLEAFVQAATATSITGSDIDAAAAADRFLEVALRIELAIERAG
ncbi:MAG TPA: hypothetical protein VGF99_00770 [Myxococcota bacterium]